MAPLLALAAGISGCFYTEVINLPPLARIERVSPAAPVRIGLNRTVDFTAQPSLDENGDPLRYDWLAQPCATCPAISNSLMVFKVPVTRHDPIRVHLTVTDAHGAFSTATTEVQVVNTPPTVTIQAQTDATDQIPRVTRRIDFLATGSDEDGDTELSYRFAVFAPPGAPAGHQFIRDSATSYTLIPDVSGTWEVQVTVEDLFGGRTTSSRMVTVVADEPPCIAATTPFWTPDARVILLRAGGPRRFSVDSIRDDLDPWPGSTATKFRWLIGPPDALVEITGHDLPDLVVDPTELDPGEELAVRVEVSDRVARVLPCDSRQAVCPTVECAQRLTWTAEVR